MNLTKQCKPCLSKWALLGWLLACVNLVQVDLLLACRGAWDINTKCIYLFLHLVRKEWKGLCLQKVKALHLFCKSKVHLQVLVMFKYLKYEVTQCRLTTHLLRSVSLLILPLNCIDITLYSSTLQPFPAQLLSPWYFLIIFFSCLLFCFSYGSIFFHPWFLDCFCRLTLLCPNLTLPPFLLCCVG